MIDTTAPTQCQRVWRLHGETRRVQCQMDHGHDGDAHLSGIHTAPTSRTQANV